MNLSSLHFQLLEAPLIIRNSVKGDKSCNYEKYLLDVINHSSWFMDHFGAPFVAPENENNGQCDAYSSQYGLDFKLIASKTELQEKSIHSVQIQSLHDGVYSYSPPKEIGEMTVTRFPQALRGQSIFELLKMRAQATKKQGIENDIAEYLNTIETKKNLLLFFPYRFYFEAPQDVADDIRTIIYLCQEDFGITLCYRENLYPELDTFFVFLYNHSFVMCKWTSGNMVYLDSVSVCNSKTFMHLVHSYCKTWS